MSIFNHSGKCIPSCVNSENLKSGITKNISNLNNHEITEGKTQIDNVSTTPHVLNNMDQDEALTLISELEEASKKLSYLENLLQETPNTSYSEAKLEDFRIAISSSIIANANQPGSRTKFSESTQTEFLEQKQNIDHIDTEEISVCSKQSFYLTALELRRKLEYLEHRLLELSPALNSDSEPSENGVNAELTTAENNECFPLIHSPLLNTPPYETIILNVHNEAKCRIYLNEKLHKYFQQQVLHLHEKFGGTIENANNNIHLDERHNSQDSIESSGNIIACFEPSEVDLEIKEIFTENPPITHKIVRRKVRQERGSSVPAIDSFYGTKDIAKVGHASYFIPLLNETERKCIGWRPEYHYGKWKYKLPMVPQSGSGVPLHPKKSLNDNRRHCLKYDGFSSSPDFGSLSECSSVIEPPCDSYKKTEEDSLSFITLSDSSRTSVTSCHIIPEAITVRKLVKWILPCIFKDRVNASSPEVTPEQPEIENLCELASEKNSVSNKAEEFSENCEKKRRIHQKHHHHIHFNIFGAHHPRKSNCSETSSVVTGGDIPLSNTESVTFGPLEKVDPMDTDNIAENPMHKIDLFVAQHSKMCERDEDEIQISFCTNICKKSTNLVLTNEKSEFKMNQEDLEKEASVIVKNCPSFPYEDEDDSQLNHLQMIFTADSCESTDCESGDENSSQISASSVMRQPPRRKLCRSNGQHKIATLNITEDENNGHEKIVLLGSTMSTELEVQNRDENLRILTDSVEVENWERESAVEAETKLKTKLFEMHTFTQDYMTYLSYQTNCLKAKIKNNVEMQETRFLDPKDLINDNIKSRHHEQDSSTSFWNVSDDISSVDTAATEPGSAEGFFDSVSSGNSVPTLSVKGTAKVGSPMVPKTNGSWSHQMVNDQYSSSRSSVVNTEENANNFTNCSN